MRRNRQLVLRSWVAALIVAGALGLGACSNSDANSGDTNQRGSGGAEPGAREDQPGGTPGGQTNPQGEGSGTGRADP